MRLRWTTPAANDLYNIVQRIRRDNPTIADEVASILYDGCGSLRDFPGVVAGGGSKVLGNWFLLVCLTSLFTEFKIRP